jgi:hypothetical protein
MRLFLQDGPARLQLLTRGHVREFRDVGMAREFLRPLLAHEGNVESVRRTLGAAHFWSAGELLEQLARQVVDDGMLVVSCAESYLASLQGTFQDSTAASSAATASQSASSSEQQTAAAATTPLQDEEAAQAAQQQAPAAPETHFIEINLKDEDGNPVAGEMYFVELPDGSSISGSTDSNGRARVDGVDPGTAKVSFPNLDKSLYNPGG